MQSIKHKSSITHRSRSGWWISRCPSDEWAVHICYLRIVHFHPHFHARDLLVNLIWRQWIKTSLHVEQQERRRRNGKKNQKTKEEEDPPALIWGPISLSNERNHSPSLPSSAPYKATHEYVWNGFCCDYALSRDLKLEPHQPHPTDGWLWRELRAFFSVPHRIRSATRMTLSTRTLSPRASPGKDK